MAKRTRLKVTNLDGPGEAIKSSTPNGNYVTAAAVDNWFDLNLPQPGSQEEDERFNELYARMPALWKNLSADGHIPQTVVVVPSMSLDPEELAKLKGAQHYEERMLFLLILLSSPKTRVIFVTSEPIHPFIIDYYLQLLPGIPFSHARARLELFAVHDTSPKSLTQKILDRPALLRRIRKAIANDPNSHLTVFNVTEAEKSLSVALGIPLLGTDPRHLSYGSKSGCRKLFREAGVALAEGFEDLKNESEILEAIYKLKKQRPDMQRVVIKINDGFSGDGNAILNLGTIADWSKKASCLKQLKETIASNVRFQAPGMNWSGYLRKYEQMQGIVEEFIEGENKASPSVQLRITPLGETQIISTHDQVLGGPDGQVFVGCTFPAEREYQDDLHEAGLKVGQHLASKGVIGRLAVDFLCTPTAAGAWDLWAVEINLRSGGTTHPFRTLQFLTGGRYNHETGLFEAGLMNPKFYFASDNLESEKYRGLLPEDLIDITTFNGLHYNSSSNTGVVFHMIGALSQFGKLGVTCVGDSPEEARGLYQQTIEILDRAVDEVDWIV